MADQYPRPPRGKTRLILKRESGKVDLDLLLDNGGVHVIVLPDTLDLHITSVVETEQPLWPSR